MEMFYLRHNIHENAQALPDTQPPLRVRCLRSPETEIDGKEEIRRMLVSLRMDARGTYPEDREKVCARTSGAMGRRSPSLGTHLYFYETS